MTTVTGDDGRERCAWSAADPEYRRYHDEEWGVPLHGDTAVFEKLSLEGFQAGLSWITILRRREGIRAAFARFDPRVLATWGEEEVTRLLADARIIRNRAKVEAALTNARVLVQLLDSEGEGALDTLVWSFAPAPRAESERPVSFAHVPATTPESTALSKELRRRGFRFVGPTTMYALMQSGGLVDDHLAGCWRAGSASAGSAASAADPVPTA